MRAEILRHARGYIPPSLYSSGEPAKPAVLLVDGVRWTSQLPENAGDAESINRDAEEVSYAINTARPWWKP